LSNIGDGSWYLELDCWRWVFSVVRSVLAIVATMLFFGWLLVLASGIEIAQAVLVGHRAPSVSLGQTSHFRLWLPHFPDMPK
jgi:hypothetical protein